MYFEEIPCYTIFDEVQRSVANAILSASDTAEFLGDESYGLGDINELYGKIGRASCRERVSSPV